MQPSNVTDSYSSYSQPQEQAGSSQSAANSGVHQDAAPAGDPYENWASPEEVLQFRALWEASTAKHAQEAADLRRRLLQTEKERDALFDEVRETERLREQYIAARSSFESVRQEKSHWLEEREMLMLRLQRMANEIDRLRHHRAPHPHPTSSNPHAGAAQSGSSSNMSVGLTMPSYTPTWGSSQPSSLLGMTTAEETVRLLEELHRQSLLASAMEQRFDLQGMITSFEVERLHRQRLLTVGENEMLRSKVRIMSDADDETRRSLRFAQQEANSLKDELDAAELKRRQLEDKKALDMMDLERNWEGMWKDDVQEKEKRWRVREDDLVEQVKVLQEEKERLERLRDEILLAKNSMVEQCHAELSERDLEMANLKAQLTAAQESLREAEQLRVHQATLTADEVHTLVVSRGDAERKCSAAQLALESTQRELHELRMYNEQQGIGLAKLLQRNAELSKVADCVKTIEGERDAYRVRATHLDEEIAVQQEFYEKQLRVAHGAFETLQRQKRAESDAVLREMVVLRTALAKRSGPKKKPPRREAGEQAAVSIPAAQQHSEPDDRGAPAVTPTTSQPRLDALSILKSTKALADRLQTTVMRGPAM